MAKTKTVAESVTLYAANGTKVSVAKDKKDAYVKRGYSATAPKS